MATSNFPYSVYVRHYGFVKTSCVVNRTADFEYAFNTFMQLGEDVCSVVFYDENLISDENPTGLRFKK